MRRTALMTIAGLLAISSLALAPIADAKSKKQSLSVKVTPSFLVDCTIAPDQARIAFFFEGKVTAKNVGKPKRITVAYTATNPTTAAVVKTQKVTLKPKKYVGIGGFFEYTVGTSMDFDGSFTYRDTISGKMKTAKTHESVPLPTNDELTAGGIKPCV